MAEQSKPPFELLSWEEKKAAIDITIAVAVLCNRLPSVGKLLFDHIETEFANSYTLPLNRARYSLRGLGQTLGGDQDWKFTVTKEGYTMVTEFKVTEQENGGGNLIK